MLNFIVEGLIQPPQISPNYSYFLVLLLTLSIGPPTLLSEQIIGVYVALQLVWSLLLWIRAARVVGSQSARRELEEKAKEASLTWMDVFRFSVAELICHRILRFELGAQVCMLYCVIGALRAVAKSLFYVLLCLSAGPEWATKLTGYNPGSLLASLGWGGKMELASGLAWAQQRWSSGAGTKATSAQVRVSSLAPSQKSGGTKNNNDRCRVLDEGLHFNRSARGCLLKYSV
ncbi:hypothetical protein LSCM4_01023 [Leishmania orientalis]|uniref:Uncharacterized protein n=1 Tax=Leishmania orientalis TaxID=2249476 RepID=A0A836FRP4_9TRYP|nr:hypothetical protein LSCM4_01023 [Leishmania orientalis]